MKTEIKNKYLVFPVSNEALSKNIRFYSGETLVYDLMIGLDAINPTFFAYVDMERFRGMVLDIVSVPEMELCLSQTEKMAIPDVYQEAYRPQVHFTVKNGWNNDPNGLLYVGGEYHMFYQYNPCSSYWGNMHWGHAVSSDLFHWRELDTALYPDELGTMYSGSAVIDSENVTKLKTGSADPIILFYTAAGGSSELSHNKKFSQCVAYSIDGGRSYVKYAGNPIIKHIEADNRDPKVIYCRPLSAWLMAIYLDGDRYELFRSQDLLHWTAFQKISLPGDNECPDIFPLATRDGEKWVLIGAHDRYLVGDFQEGLFVPCQGVKQLNYGDVYYAAQTFSDVPNGRRIRIGWQRVNIPERRFSQQMGIPTELSLMEDGTELALCSWPVRELEALYAEAEHVLLSREENYRGLIRSPYDIRIAITKADAPVRITIFGTAVTVDAEKKSITAEGVTLPIISSGGSIELGLVSDRFSLELFTAGAVTTIAKAADYNLPYISMESEKDFSAEAQVYRLRSALHGGKGAV